MMRKNKWIFIIPIMLLVDCKDAINKKHEVESVEMEVKGVTLDSNTNSPVVILEDIASKKLMPIWIGFSEARAIAAELEGVSPPRPMTHDLLQNIITGLGGKVERIAITELKNQTFYAVIAIRARRRSFRFDCRPSDAIALALRFKSLIYVSREVFDSVQTISSLPEGWEDVVMGFSVQELSRDIAEAMGINYAAGILVSDVREGSSSEKDGLRRGDIIISVNGESISTIKNLVRVISESEDRPMKTDIIREGQKLSLELHPGETEQ
ncbi:MAG TPA: bifunctional nuclease domain-containing protein, partial [bacterium]